MKAFWDNTIPFKSPTSTWPHSLILEVQRYNDTVRFVLLGMEVNKTASRTAIANLDCAFVMNTLVFVYQKLGNPLTPSFRPSCTKLPYVEGSHKKIVLSNRTTGGTTNIILLWGELCVKLAMILLTTFITQKHTRKSIKSRPHLLSVMEVCKNSKSVRKTKNDYQKFDWWFRE